MENKSLPRIGMLIGFGLAFIAGSITSGAFLRGSLAETGTCLSQALTEYIGAQNKHIKEHASVIQSIVENLQVTLKASNGTSIATDFSSVSARFQAEDKAFATKINAMSDTYKMAQSKCQFMNAGGVTSIATSSSVPTVYSSSRASSVSTSSHSSNGLTNMSSSRNAVGSLSSISSSQSSLTGVLSSSSHTSYDSNLDPENDNGGASPLSSSHGTVSNSSTAENH